jgi:hypothetical protein
MSSRGEGPPPRSDLFLWSFVRYRCRPNLPIKCSSSCRARFMPGRSNLATRMILDARGRSPHVPVKLPVHC